MNIKRIVGTGIIASPIVGMIIVMGASAGFKATCMIWAGSFAVTAFFMYGVKLLIEADNESRNSKT